MLMFNVALGEELWMNVTDISASCVDVSHYSMIVKRFAQCFRSADDSVFSAWVAMYYVHMAQ